MSALGIFPSPPHFCRQLYLRSAIPFLIALVTLTATVLSGTSSGGAVLIHRLGAAESMSVGATLTLDKAPSDNADYAAWVMIKGLPSYSPTIPFVQAGLVRRPHLGAGVVRGFISYQDSGDREASFIDIGVLREGPHRIEIARGPSSYRITFDGVPAEVAPQVGMTLPSVSIGSDVSLRGDALSATFTDVVFGGDAVHVISPNDCAGADGDLSLTADANAFRIKGTFDPIVSTRFDGKCAKAAQPVFLTPATPATASP